MDTEKVLEFIKNIKQIEKNYKNSGGSFTDGMLKEFVKEACENFCRVGLQVSKANGGIKQIIRNTIDEYFLDVENCNYINNLTFKDKINFVKLVLLDIKVKIVSRLPC